MSIRVNSFYGNNCIKYESNGDKNKTLSPEEYLEEIKPYLKDSINNLKKSGTWEIQLSAEINSISSTDADEKHLMYSFIENIGNRLLIKQTKLSKNFMDYFFLNIKIT